MQIRNSYVLYVCVLGLMIAMTASSAQATFSNASLKGGYSVLINRWTPNSSENEDGLVAVMTFDGAGNVSVSYTDMSGGVEKTGNGSGTYSISANGTGTITLTTGVSAEFAIVLNSSAAGLAKGFSLLETDTNNPADAVVTGTAVLQATTAVTYGLGKLKGNLGFELNSWTITSTEDGIIGIFSFNGVGGVKGSFTDKGNSGVTTGTFTGTYTVNSDGSGSMSLKTSDGGTPTLAFVLNTVTSTGPAKGLQVLQTSNSSNKVLAGAALKQ